MSGTNDSRCSGCAGFTIGHIPECKNVTPAERLAEISKLKEALEIEEAAIYEASLKAAPEEKVAPDWMASMLSEPSAQFKYPIQVNRIVYGPEGAFDRRQKGVGQFVAIRPCDEALKGKTFLGIYIGGAALQVSVRFDAASGVLQVSPSFHNPAIYVPDLERVIMGCESWWGFLKKPDDLKQITDQDIQNVWYVRALQSLNEPDTAKS